LNTATFTENGGVSPVDDQHNPLAAYTFEGTDDKLTSSEKPFSNGSSGLNTFAMWLKVGSSFAGDVPLIGQWSATAATKTFLVYINNAVSKQLTVAYANNDTNRTQSGLNLGTDNWDDEGWHFIVGTSNGTDINIYIDGSEASAYAFQDSNSGSGFSDFPSTQPTLTLAQLEDDSWNWANTYTLSRPQFWKGTKLSDCQVAKLYSNEQAAIGEGWPTLVGGLGRPSFRLDPIRQTRYNRGPTRFSR
jgi:hypothetical protein